MDKPSSLRIAIISSPRAGSSWLRRALGATLDIPELGYHDIKDLPNDLPTHCIIQIHWDPENELIKYLKKHQFTVITITRHPLDILISVLNFTQNEPLSLRWLNGKAHTGKIYGLKPTDNEFIEYCKSRDAGKLLDVSYLWNHFEYPKKIKLNYEKTINDKKHYLKQILSQLKLPIDDRTIDKALSESSFTVFKKLPNHHGWVGKVDNWKHYFTKDNSHDIYLAQEKYFKVSSYSVGDANSKLTNSKIIKTWENKSSSACPPDFKKLIPSQRELLAYTDAYIKSSDKNKIDEEKLHELKTDNQRLSMELTSMTNKLSTYDDEIKILQGSTKSTRYRISFRNYSRIINKDK